MSMTMSHCPGGGGQRHRFGPGDTHVIAGLEDLPIHADAAADHLDERLGASGNEMLKRRLLQRGKIDVGIHIEGKRKALRR